MSEAPAPVVAAEGLTRTFGPTVAVDGLTLEVRRGEVFGILGHNGAGKTTLLRLINGLLRPTSGTVTTLGGPSYRAGATIRRRTGVVTESTALDDFLTIREHLLAYGAMSGRSATVIARRADELLSTFGLAEVADRQARELSAGMRQRAAFARGLVHDPELLLLDEPTANMDPVAARKVRHLVADLARQAGRTVVLSTHNLAEAQDVCDRIAVLRRGHLQALGTMAELSRLVAAEVPVTVLTDPGAAGLAWEVAGRFGIVTSNGQPGRISVQGAGGDRIPTLIAALVHAGVPVREVTGREPSLEEIYVALHERKERVWTAP